MRLVVFTLLALSSSLTVAQVTTHGTINKKSAEWAIWSADKSQWIDIETFWLDYAEKHGGLTWGDTDKYPEYKQVKEFDTLIIQTKKGSCLMQFFHQRWRRANDVRRWDDAMNEYSGCPYVFD